MASCKIISKEVLTRLVKFLYNISASLLESLLEFGGCALPK
jgi:hypothetical protein